MVGLVVTPTTLCSSTSDCRLPLRMRSRERSSSQTATPAFDSCARFSFWAIVMPSCRFCWVCSAVAGGALEAADGDAGAGRRDARRVGRLEALAGGGDDGVGGEAELLVELRVARAGAVVVQRDHPAGVPDEVAPAHRHAGLDAHPGPHRRREHLGAVCLVLL